jgi:D-threo-aldose 1-dehydrogenase
MEISERGQVGSSAVEVSRLGFGSACLGNLYAPVSDAESEQTVAAALEEGVRYFDTAPYYGYGLAERRLGKALCGRPRRSYVISTKVGRLLEPRKGAPRSDQGFIDALPFDPVFDYSYPAVMRSVEESLERMCCERLDILLLHDLGELTHGAEAHPSLFESAMEGGYRALEALRAEGSVGALGLGVNECEVCLEAVERGDFDCFLIAGRYTLLDQSALERLLPECAKRRISVIVGGPYNSGILAGDLGPDSRYDYQSADPSVIARAWAIQQVCAAHAVPLPAAALQFPLLHPAVVSVIPGARSRQEVKANAAHLRHPIPEVLWRDLMSEGLLDPSAPVKAAP